MSALLLDGRAIASDVLREVKAYIETLSRPVVVRAIVVKPSPATESYLRIKVSRAEEAGIRMEVVRLADTVDDAGVIRAVQEPGSDAVIVQLPMPQEFSSHTILDSIPAEFDADVLSTHAAERFENNIPGSLVPPVAAAVLEMLERGRVDVVGKNVVVVGQGQLVGRPVSILLARLGANVSVVKRETPNKEALYKAADIIVSGAGAAHIITPDMIQTGVVLIDAGTSGKGGGVAGDIHPDCVEKASIFTPVPGGVGPVAVAHLFKNTMLLVQASQENEG